MVPLTFFKAVYNGHRDHRVRNDIRVAPIAGATSRVSEGQRRTNRDDQLERSR